MKCQAVSEKKMFENNIHVYSPGAGADNPPLILKLGMQHWEFEVYQAYINDDTGLTLIYFTARSNLVTFMFEWGKQLQGKFAAKD